MSGLRGTVYATRIIKAKNVIGIVFSLFVVRSICALVTSTQAPASKAQAETNPPGKIVFDNFEFVSNTAPSPTVTSGTTSSGTFVTLSGTMKPWFVSLRYLVTRLFEEYIVGARGELGASTVWAKTP